MTQTRYGYLVKPLEYGTIGGPEGRSGYMTAPRGVDLEGLNVSFSWGYLRQPGTWDSEAGTSHVHPHGKVLMFTGLDYDNPNELSAEIEVTMGEKGEKLTVNSPTFVTLPAGYPHGPMVTKRADKPFGLLAVYTSGEPKSETVPLRPVDKEGDFGNLVRRFEMRDMHRREGSGNADFMNAWSGNDQPGFNLNFTWAFHTGIGPFHTHDPHVHPNDECLVFLGSDPDEPDYLGAEIEIQMGEEREVHVFTRPTVVVAPRGLVHCPLIVRKVEKPWLFTAICLNNEHDTTWLGGDPNVPNVFAMPMKRPEES